MFFSREPDLVRAARTEANRFLTLPWDVLDGFTAKSKRRALKRELGAGHAMTKEQWTAIAQNKETDDVMFVSPVGRVAIVHLTYCSQELPSFPSAAYYDAIGHALRAIEEERAYVTTLAANEGALICRSCGADWARDTGTADCPICDGFGLTRPCPACEGRCGAVWSRAVLDSNDYGYAVWIGKCRLPSD